GYYSYMWSEVLDADAFAAFEETGDIFDPATAQRLRDCVYAAGGRQEPAEAYKAFRGRLPTADALLPKPPFPPPSAPLNSNPGQSRALVQRRAPPRCCLRAAFCDGRSRPLSPCRRRQCDRSHARHGGIDRRRLSAYEPSRRRWFLDHSRALGARTRHHGGGSGG